MADCNDCTQYLSPEDIIRRSVVCSGGKVAALATNLNQDDGKWFTDNFTGVPDLFSPLPLTGVIDCGVRVCLKIGNTYHLFEETTGTAPTWRINKRTSTDGLRFTFKSAPLLSAGAAGEFDDLGQADPTVIYEGPGDWKMWYDALSTVSPGWNSLGYATSIDGTTWTKVGAVLSIGASGAWDDLFIHHPACIKDNGTYYLYYAGSRNTGTAYKIGLATSTDGINWTKHASNPVITTGTAGQFDSAYIRPSCPVKVYDKWYMWYWGYNGTNHSWGLATSSDLITWTKIGKVLGNPAGSYGEIDPVSSNMHLISGSDIKDKIVQMWYNRLAPTWALCFGTAIAPIAGTTKIGTFNKSDVAKYGDLDVSADDSVHSANYIYLHRLTVSSSITADAIKVSIKATSKPTTSGKIKLALYANGTNTPTTLLAITEEKDWSQVFSTLWEIFNFTSPVSLSATDYWIGIWSSVAFRKAKAVGGTNNHGNLSLAYGSFPNPITATTSYGYNVFDMYVCSIRPNVWDVALAGEPTKVYFNNVEGNKQTLLTAVDSEFDWIWISGVLYIYSTENPDVRYQIRYE